jgi:hypothetical protein
MTHRGHSFAEARSWAVTSDTFAAERPRGRRDGRDIRLPLGQRSQLTLMAGQIVSGAI